MNWSLVLHIAVPVILAAVVNLIVYALKWNNNKVYKRSKALPPGAAIAVIWVVLLALTGFCRWLLVSGNEQRAGLAAALLVALVLYCVSYPFVTRGMKHNVKLANTIALVLAYSTATATVVVNRKAALCLVPLVVWTTYVAVTDAVVCDTL